MYITDTGPGGVVGMMCPSGGDMLTPDERQAGGRPAVV